MTCLNYTDRFFFFTDKLDNIIEKQINKFKNLSIVYKVEKDKYFELADKLARIADLKHGYAITVHKSQGMTTDVAIYDYTTTNNTLEYILSKKTTPQDKKDAELLIHKANYTASSRAKHLMLIIDGNNSSINNEGSFVDIVDKIKSGTQEKVELTISDKKSSTASTKDSKVDVKGTLRKRGFNSLYITEKTTPKYENGIYKLQNNTFVDLTHFYTGIKYDKSKFKVGNKEYTLPELNKVLGYPPNKIPKKLLTAIFKGDVFVYSLKKYTPKKESTTTTPPPSTRKPKDEKPKEVVIDMTKQFEMYGEKFIPLLQEGNVLRIINLSNNTQQYIENINSYKSKIKTTDILIERSTKDIAIPRIKSGGNIYIVQGNDVSVYPKLSKYYNSVNKDYFTCQ
jgi:hypothetical protein